MGTVKLVIQCVGRDGYPERRPQEYILGDIAEHSLGSAMVAAQNLITELWHLDRKPYVSDIETSYAAFVAKGTYPVSAKVVLDLGEVDVADMVMAKWERVEKFGVKREQERARKAYESLQEQIESMDK